MHTIIQILKIYFLKISPFRNLKKSPKFQDIQNYICTQNNYAEFLFIIIYFSIHNLKEFLKSH